MIRYNNYKNNNLTRFFFKLTITSYLAMVMGNNKLATTKNAGELLAILIAIPMRRCGGTTWGASPN
jgi:hypothetical protein